MSVVPLEDARATGSVSCPIALWDYSRGIVAIHTYIHTLLQLPKEGFSVTKLLIN